MNEHGTTEGAPAPRSHAESAEDRLALERAHARRCRAAAAAAASAAARRVDEGAGVLAGEGVSGDGAGAEALGRYLRGQARDLSEETGGPPFFGSLHYAETPQAGEHAGERYHIGRRRIAERPAAAPLVVDWRAPVSRAFYQATAQQPAGVRRRRRYGWRPGAPGEPESLTALEDELLGESGESTPGRLVAEELARPRVGPMRDIVATIQPDQDDLVRAPLAKSLCIQGAPGTGKTAVGLHRAAYLLFAHASRLHRGGLLIVGPNPRFLDYIAQVLPALGESGVSQRTVADLVAPEGSPGPTAEEEPEAARVKHSPAFAEVLRRALHSHLRPPTEPLAVPDGAYTWRLPAEELHRIVAETAAREMPYEAGREAVRTAVCAALRSLAEQRTGPRGTAWLRRTGSSKPVKRLLDECWPKVRPQRLLARLLADEDELAAAASGALSPAEQRAVLRKGGRRGRPADRWTPADLLLLDELDGLLRHPETSLGHLIVDEAQDLSPMECRALARRSRFGSLTVLGDLAQGTTPWAARSWEEQLFHLGAPEADIVPLTTGFRVPEALTAAANAVLATLDVPVPPARSLRAGGRLRVRRSARVAEAAVDAVRRALATDGSVAVLAAPERLAEVQHALAAAELSASPTGATSTAMRVTAVAADAAKGLEFDRVVLVEPAEVVAADARSGGRHLYVAVTRAVSGLELVHQAPLPECLARARGC